MVAEMNQVLKAGSSDKGPISQTPMAPRRSVGFYKTSLLPGATI